MKGSPKLVGQA